MEELWDYLFEDDETGEVFFVECETLEEAKRVARDNFDTPKYLGKYTVDEAEDLGYDTF